MENNKEQAWKYYFRFSHKQLSYHVRGIFCGVTELPVEFLSLRLIWDCPTHRTVGRCHREWGAVSPVTDTILSIVGDTVVPPDYHAVGSFVAFSLKLDNTFQEAGENVLFSYTIKLGQ